MRRAKVCREGVSADVLILLSHTPVVAKDDKEEVYMFYRLKDHINLVMTRNLSATLLKLPFICFLKTGWASLDEQLWSVLGMSLFDAAGYRESITEQSLSYNLSDIELSEKGITPTYYAFQALADIQRA
jgi:hypothetical protein